MNYLTTHGSTKATPQGEQAAPGQAENSAGGYVFTLDPLDHVKRFLILGAEGGTYYVGERSFVRENLHALEAAVKADGPAVVDLIVDVSTNGRAKSNDPALFALAYCTAHGDDLTRKAAYNALPEVARIGTHLFHFADYREGFGGWGRGMRKAVGRWYTGRSLRSLATQLVKYRQRDGWSHRDLLRLAHVDPNVDAKAAARDLAFKFATTGEFDPSDRAWVTEQLEELALIPAFLQAQRAEAPSESAALVRHYGLPREALRPEHLDSPEVWGALLEKMPPEAMLRNLATMTRNGTLKALGSAESKVVGKLRDVEALRSSRLHPLSVLNARAIYGAGGSNPYGLSQGGAFVPSNAVLGALDDAFYATFDNVEPARKRFLLALDVSGSMGTLIGGGRGAGLTCRDASAAMALVTARTEPAFHSVCFTAGGESFGQSAARYTYGRQGGVQGFPMSGGDTLDGVIRAMQGYQFGATDCALPMLYATANGLDVDCFVVYTDNETWAGAIHPHQALVEYRKASGIDAKLVVCGMTSTGFTIADPSDPGMLDVVGFDTATPALISAFARGDF